MAAGIASLPSGHSGRVCRFAHLGQSRVGQPRYHRCPLRVFGVRRGSVDWRERSGRPYAGSPVDVVGVRLRTRRTFAGGHTVGRRISYTDKRLMKGSNYRVEANCCSAPCVRACWEDSGAYRDGVRSSPAPVALPLLHIPTHSTHNQHTMAAQSQRTRYSCANGRRLCDAWAITE